MWGEQWSVYIYITSDMLLYVAAYPPFDISLSAPDRQCVLTFHCLIVANYGV